MSIARSILGEEGRRGPRRARPLLSLLVAAGLLLSACVGGGGGPATPSMTFAPTEVAASTVAPSVTPAVAATTRPAVIATPPPAATPIASVTRVSAGAATVPTATRAPVPPRGTPAPRGEQTLTLAGGVEAPPTFDPALIRDAASSFLARQVYSGLVKLDDGLAAAPDLAEALPVVSADRLTYTFTLRAGILFHDGAPLTAQMVKDSFERATDPRLARGDGLALPAATYLIDIKGVAARLKGERPEIEGIRVTGPRTLEVELVAPQATFLVKLTHATAAVVDVRQAGGRDWWKRPNATGPFRLSEWRAGDRLVLTRWERYYDGPPILERVVWLLGANAGQPLNLYEGGKIDVTELGVGTIDRALVPSSPLNRELRITPQLSLTYVAFNVTEPPFDDLKVRQAFVQAIDRQKVARVMFEGKVEEAIAIVPPALLAPDLSPPAGDQAARLAAARGLLASSRYGASPPRARLYVSGGGIGSLLHEVYTRDLGVEVDVIVVTWNDFLEGLNAREYAAYSLSWLADYPDPQGFLETLFRSGSPENHTNYANQRVDALLDRAARETDEATRAGLYRQAQRLIIEDAVMLPLYHGIEYTLVKPHVKGLIITPLGVLGLERVWIER